MPGSLSSDLRRRVLTAYDNGEGTIEGLAARFMISVSSINRWLKRRRLEGHFEPLPHGGGQRSAFEGQLLEDFRQLVLANPDATEAELLELWPHPASVSSVHRALVKLGLTRKKNAARRRNR